MFEKGTISPESSVVVLANNDENSLFIGDCFGYGQLLHVEQCTITLTLIHRSQKGVDGSCRKLPGSGNTHSRRSDSPLRCLAPTVHTLFHNQAFVDSVMASSLAYRQFNSNFTCGDPDESAAYELINSGGRGTAGHNVRLPRR
ncbi:hypothetical protein AVEN_114774-1 [Araneus ventricosus]|uniref:Uncharacterized protein n=1 Tax=Araneus ventricosus TaxID=182803 RepID=A0A4Y2HIR7_ARAVE|nr:hypothetical protein AVEN_114774-1 [Araneus ventricosus]